MENRPKFSLYDRLKSIKYAFNGIRIMLISEHNAWIHAAATILVCVLSFYLGISRYDWCWIVVAVLLVWAAEALNTAFEFLADVAVPEFHPIVEKAKDVSAAAVLVASIGAIIIGVIILGPYLM